MHFEKGYLFHIYNKGNNKQKIFFERENYLFFLKKMHSYLLPYGHIIAWCLMPNHFHWMVEISETTVNVAQSKKTTVGVAQSDTDGKSFKQRTLNDSIGILLRSYTSAINKQQNRSGKLFREATKAECLNCPNGIAPSFYIHNGITTYYPNNAEKEYPEVCYHYIHQNPVKAGLVEKANDWEFSSARDYAGLRNGKLINKEVAAKYICNIHSD